VPAVTAGCFRDDFFFSFLGRIVSVLGFWRNVLLVLCAPPPGARATWGMDVTVSVSTVIFCSEISPAFPFTKPGFTDELDCLVVRGGAAMGPDRRPALTLPLSLPLSFKTIAAALPTRFLTTELSAASGCDVSEMKLSSSFSSMDTSVPRGDPRGLTSWTVSKVDAVPPGPRAGVLTPDELYASSVSVSDGTSGPEGCGGVARCKLIDGVSCSPRRGGTRFGL